MSQPDHAQESEPFLDGTDADYDIELQGLGPEENLRQSDGLLNEDSDHSGQSHIRDDEFDGGDRRLSSSSALWRRRLWRELVSGFRTSAPSHSRSRNRRKQRKLRTIRPLTTLWRFVVAFIICLGLIQLTTIILGVFTAFFPETLDHSFRTWRSQENLSSSSHWPTDYTADIRPVACHSHNDYWRRVPLESAIQAGCTSVEADVWLIEDELYVGHKESALTAERTLRSLYVDPLVKMLDRQNPITAFQPTLESPRNGVFDTDPSQTLVLLIDFKTSYQRLWPLVEAQLDPLRQRHYLAHFNGTALVPGPVTVVVTGNAPFDLVVLDMHRRDMFFDAPLSALASIAPPPPPNPSTSTSPPASPPLSRPDLELAYIADLEESFLHQNQTSSATAATNTDNGQGYAGHPPSNPAIYTPSNSYYASTDFQASVGYPRPYLSASQRDTIAAQIRGAHAQGLKVRYWDVPNWPIGMRNYLWRELVKAGVDVLNVDDLYSATRGDWRSSGGWWVWGWSLWGGRDW